MIIRQKKGMFALSVVLILFLAAVVFILGKTTKTTVFAADGDLIYNISVSGGGSITGTDKYSQVSQIFNEGSGSIDSDVNKEIIFSAKKYYKFSAVIEWTGGNVAINGITEVSPGHVMVNDETELRIEALGDGIDEITVDFFLEKIEYRAVGAVKLFENYVLREDNSNANADIEFSSQTIKVDDEITISIQNEGANQRFLGYYLSNKLTGNCDYKSSDKTMQITFGSDLLDNYLLPTGEVMVIGAFIKTYSVEISDYVDSSYPQNFIEITISNKVTGFSDELKNKNEIENFFGSGQVLDQFSYIKIVAKDNPYFDFEKFMLEINDTPDNDILDTEYVISSLDANYKIDVQYKKTEYSVSIDCIDNFGRLVEDSANQPSISGLNQNNKFCINDVITIDLSAVLLYDKYLTLKEDATQNLITITEAAKIPGIDILYNGSIAKITINAEFLDIYINRNNNSLKLILNFSIKYEFSITLIDTTGLENSYSVSVNGVTSEHTGNYTSQNPFDYGTVITIIINPSIYASYTCSAYKDEQNDKTITIVLNYSDRNIEITFMLAKFKIEDKTKKFDGYSAKANTADGSLENLSIGNIITISVVPSDNNYEITKWVIKGKDGTKIYDVLNGISGYETEYANGTLKIVVNEKWLEDFRYEFTNEVTTGLKTSVLLMIIIPSVAVPFLIVLLLSLLIVNAKRKKFIKAELMQEKKTAYTYNTGSMIEDLREDKYNKITDEDIKAKMKKKKK